MMHCSLSLSVHHRESGILQPNRIHRLPQHPRDPDTGRVRLRAPPPLPYQSDQAPHSGRIEHTQSVLQQQQQQQQQHGPVSMGTRVSVTPAVHYRSAAAIPRIPGCRATTPLFWEARGPLEEREPITH
ncbi:hypothetical protein INR49_007299 [Caranx melampygus]|nr:hypothetical protein INR49_007299 [Caranx melampygus]